MAATASVLHADLDAFYASVEQRDRPELRGRPVVVGGGVVLAASYEARAHGVRSAMGGTEARRRCPGAVVVAPRFDAYTEASRAVFACFADVTPRVEALSIDEAFLDVSGAGRLLGDPVHIAERLRADVRDRVGLPLSVGVASTKFLAKVASQQAKPDGCCAVAAGGELAFLHPLPVGVLWGVGPVTRQRLVERGVSTVGDLALLSEVAVGALLGRAAGRHLHHLAWNRDPRTVVTDRRDRSIGSQRALGRRPRPRAELSDLLVGLADRVAGRLRGAGRLARTVTVTVRFADQVRTTRSRTLIVPTDDTSVLVRTAEALLGAAVDRPADDGPAEPARAVTLVGVRLSGLCRPDAVQLGLPFDTTGRGAWQAVDGGVDRIRARFGTAAVARAATLGRGEALAVPARPSAADRVR